MKTKIFSKQGTISFNNKELDITIHAYWDFDECYEIEDATEEKQITVGDLVPAVIVIDASLSGISGRSVLGGCLLSIDTKPDFYIEEYSMVTEAIEDLRAQLIHIKKLIA